jgi:YVTN family beta-propeller protein
MRFLFTIPAFIFLWSFQFAGGRIIVKNSEKKNEKGLRNKLPAGVLIANGAPLPDDTLPSYSNIIFEKKEMLTSAPGTKSVLFNSSGTRLYAMNLEGMSIYEFDRHTRKILREFKFRPTQGMGWDYEKDTVISSFEEKPVEACFSNNDKILWISLHNAGGIVPILIDSLQLYPGKNDSIFTKHITIVYPSVLQKDSFDVPLVKTGKTPKVIAKTADDKNLLVSNWHSSTVTVLELDTWHYPFAKVIATIPVAAIPRGIAIDDKNYKSYVAIMGGSSIIVIDNQLWKKENELQVAANPRHLVIDTAGRLFVSYNKLSQIACINTETGKTLFTAATHTKPRTIALSRNKQFLFVTCYEGNTVDVFKIDKDRFKKLYSIECKGKPVGVDIYEDRDKLEAWVCTYMNGTIDVLSFKKIN